MQIIRELKKLANTLPEKAEPLPVAMTELGQIGHLTRRQGLYINSAIRHHVVNILRDEARAERAAREVSRGRMGASDILPLMARASDSRDAIRVIKSMRSTIGSWDAVIAARAAGKYWDSLGTKASQSTTANQWSSFFRTGGVPGAVTYNNIPGPAALDSNTAGAWPLPMALGASDTLYLTNLGTNHATGTNLVLAVDLIQAAGNISGTVTTTQSIATTTLPRWTGGAGLMMTLEVTTALGATAANVTIQYTDQDGNTLISTGAIPLTTSAIAGRLVPIQDGPLIRLAAGDYGVRSITSALLSASMLAGVLAALLYKPIVVIPTLSTISFAERSTPAMIGGIKALTSVPQGSKPCLGFFVNGSTSSTGNQTYLIETVYG